ncbi:MAG: hypothetical protein ACJAT4_002763 [Granulosicoccus sp.]|jgi:hypothetical protein
MWRVALAACQKGAQRLFANTKKKNPEGLISFWVFSMR